MGDSISWQRFCRIPLVRTDKVRADTTVVEAAVAYPTDSGLLAKAVGSMTRTVGRIQAPSRGPTQAVTAKAMGKMRRQFTLTPAGKPILPNKVGWLHSEMLKTGVAHGYCARHPTASAFPYANICETCDNYITAPEFRGALNDQLADIQALKSDAENRGWADEAARHDRVAQALADHLQRLDR